MTQIGAMRTCPSPTLMRARRTERLFTARPLSACCSCTTGVPARRRQPAR